MPYKSMKQERWAHTASGKKALGKKTVNEFDQASKGVDLPEKAEPAVPIEPTSLPTLKPLQISTGHGYAMKGEHVNG